MMIVRFCAFLSIINQRKGLPALSRAGSKHFPGSSDEATGGAIVAPPA